MQTLKDLPSVFRLLLIFFGDLIIAAVPISWVKSEGQRSLLLQLRSSAPRAAPRTAKGMSSEQREPRKVSSLYEG